MNSKVEYDEWKVAQKCVHLLNTNQRKEANENIIQAMEYISQNGTKYGDLWASILEIGRAHV